MRRSTATKIALFIGSAMLVSCLIEASRADDAETSEVAASNKLQVTILNPAVGDSIPRVFDNLRGTILGSMPKDYQLYCFIKDRFNFFVQSPQPSVAANGKWKQMNVRCATKGSWELHLVLANPDAIEIIDGRIKDGIFAGMQKLPDGAVSLDYVEVQVK